MKTVFLAISILLIFGVFSCKKEAQLQSSSNVQVKHLAASSEHFGWD